MARSDKLLMFTGSDDVLEIPANKPMLPPSFPPRISKQMQYKYIHPSRKGGVVRCSDEAYQILCDFAFEYRVPIARVIDALANHLITDQATFRAVISQLTQ